MKTKAEQQEDEMEERERGSESRTNDERSQFLSQPLF